MKRLLPKTERIPGGIRVVPLWLAMPFLLFTLVLFLFGPYDWPIRSWWIPLIYVPSVFFVLALGFVLATRAGGVGKKMERAGLFYVVGALGTLALLVPTALIYTGKWPWQIAAALADQREAYSALAKQLEETRGARGPFAMLRAAVAPFAFCVLPLAVIYWRSLSRTFKLLAALVVFCSVNMSILRGTTRELADLVIVGGSAYMVLLARNSISHGVSLGRSLLRRWRLIILAPILIMTLAGVLVGRTEARLGGQRILCLANSGACISNSEPWRSMSDSDVFGIATVSGYLSQGYFGLSLAADKDFRSTLGIGHSPALSALYLMLGGNEEVTNRAYTWRAHENGWSDATQCSTLIAWIANDVGLAGAVLFVLLLGLAWGRSWINATHGRDDHSAVFFCVIMMMIFYLPANNQMMATFDGYATLLFWGAAAMFKRGASSA